MNKKLIIITTFLTLISTNIYAKTDIIISLTNATDRTIAMMAWSKDCRLSFTKFIPAGETGHVLATKENCHSGYFVYQNDSYGLDINFYVVFKYEGKDWSVNTDSEKSVTLVYQPPIVNNGEGKTSRAYIIVKPNY
jgi:hypothetical protein